ncbi:winged helix-turn-helix transcriptional regulator [Caulobacter sp.]|uniref:winged helix-turn-helix transcriptional regulator n=1 Tax=Caulobacter sp. TaxID=78 RepID=UPI003BAF8475
MQEFGSNNPEPIVLHCGHEDPVAFRELLTKVGDKWSILTLLGLSMMPGDRARFSELSRTLLPISERMLALTLRSLERDGLITREVFAEVPPRVEYELAPPGRSLLPALQGLVDWVATHGDQVKASRSDFDAR